MEEIINSCLKIVENIKIPQEIVKKIVEKTFLELNSESTLDDKMAIDYNFYRMMIRKNP